MNNPDNMKLFVLLKNYIFHARKIHAKSIKTLYRTEPRLNALDDCMRYLNAFHPGSCALSNIIPYIAPELHTILPSKSNSSYQGSLKKLNDIINLSQKIKNETRNANYKPECQPASE